VGKRLAILFINALPKISTSGVDLVSVPDPTNPSVDHSSSITRGKGGSGDYIFVSYFCVSAGISAEPIVHTTSPMDT